MRYKNEVDNNSKTERNKPFRYKNEVDINSKTEKNKPLRYENEVDNNRNRGIRMRWTTIAIIRRRNR